jgi:hypothetical protein
MPSTSGPVDAAERASDAYAAMQATFYQRSSKLYYENHPFDPARDPRHGYLWSFEEAAQATLLMHGMPHAADTYARAIDDRLAAREAYWDGSRRPRGYRSFPGTGDRYFDDNCWTGSNLLHHHARTSTTPRSTALERAQSVFSYIQTGWTTSLPRPGGVRWVDATFNGDRAVDSTAGWSKLGADLYAATGRQTHEYLEWAVRAYDWSKQHLLAANGLYANAVRADGAIDHTQWIYNQGIMIGAAVLLHRVTGSSTYVADAVSLADATFDSFGSDRYYSGSMGAYSGRAIFNAIFFRNLMLLHAVVGNSAYIHKMQEYADAAWSDPAVRDPRTNLYRLNGEPRYSLLDQAAMIQVYALLTWTPEAYAALH